MIRMNLEPKRVKVQLNDVIQALRGYVLKNNRVRVYFRQDPELGFVLTTDPGPDLLAWSTAAIPPNAKNLKAIAQSLLAAEEVRVRMD